MGGTRPSPDLLSNYNVFPINQTIDTDPKDFEMTLTLIEMLPGNIMRWTFNIWNKTGKPQTVYMANGSYVVDDSGNKYNIIQGMGVTIQAGERTDESVTFSSPKSEGTSFSLYIDNSIGVQFPNPPIVTSIQK
jgi:hypothetical protein